MARPDLFDEPVEHLEGLSLISDFISPDEHRFLLEQVDGQPWRGDLKRRTQHYGWRYDYKSRTVYPSDFIGHLPEWLQGIAQRLLENGAFERCPDQAIVNEYLPGQGISAHVDCQPCFGDTIAGLSLGGRCVMDFSHPQQKQKVSILLESRSLLVLSGPARFEWRHGIAARKSDMIDGARHPRERRVSITFRTVRQG
ncbi:MAG: alpha-ketoglutarate-dependent dioxygenase AlkB [Pseudomonadota bacterium]